jgi:L-amino acid N-acyltransferase YncA
MSIRPHFKVEKSVSTLLELLPQIQEIADSEKEALGFLSQGALKDAIIRERLFALTVNNTGSCEVAGYILYSGVFPRAKIQQIATLEKHRKVGVASTLINCLVSDLEHSGFMTLRADVASDLQSSLAFYIKNGFEVNRERAGGMARRRTIIVHVKQLDTPDLFSLKSDSLNLDFATKPRNAADLQLFAFDLNIYFDLARDREKSDQVRRLFGAALAHEIRLVVADEFVAELQKTANRGGSDPILQMALRMPRLPKADKTRLDALTDKIHDLVFVKPKVMAAGSKQAISDARHLAHAALSRASAFVTRDGALLNARVRLINEVGIDVISPDELVGLLPPDAQSGGVLPSQGNGFKSAALSGVDLDLYLSEANISDDLKSGFQSDSPDAQSYREAIYEDNRIVAVGAIQIPRQIKPVARLLIHVRPEHFDGNMFADYLLNSLTRFACNSAATTIELVHMPGQSKTHALAKARGFTQISTSRNYRKVALGKPLTPDNWTNAVQEIRHRTGLILPDQIPDFNSAGEEVNLTMPTGQASVVPIYKLEDILAPTILIWPGRDGVIAPINRVYADDLLGTNSQSNLSFIESPDAAFLSRRAYVNSPRTATVMRPGRPIFFYESKRKSNGRGAVVAVARIIDSVVIQKNEVSSEIRQRLVVDDIDTFSASEDVLVTTFDNLLVLPKPVPFNALKNIEAIGRANLVTAVSLSSEKMTKIIYHGWSSD